MPTVHVTPDHEGAKSTIWLAFIPWLAFAVISHRDTPTAGAVIALIAAERGVRRLFAVDDAAAGLGLFVGQKATDAAALVPELAVADADPAADQAALEALCDWCARFSPAVALDAPEFTLDPGPATVLPFNRILAVAGFRCNVQESGVSCISERSGKGFTFSDDGVFPQYTDVPADAP